MNIFPACKFVLGDYLLVATHHELSHNWLSHKNSSKNSYLHVASKTLNLAKEPAYIEFHSSLLLHTQIPSP